MQRDARVIFTLTFFISLASSMLYAQVSWIKDPANPVMSGEGPGTWNRSVNAPNVLYNADSTRYEMWYRGSHGPDAQGIWYPHQLGFATSKDGINWIKHPYPVIASDSGAWDESYVWGKVIRENGQYKIWYAGGNATQGTGGIGYATSPDGINWTKDTLNNPIIMPGSADWEAGGYDLLSYCNVLHLQGEEYKMWYGALNSTGSQRSIGFATSPDGISWQKDTLNNPVLLSENINAWDYSVFVPQVILVDGVYHMFYLGWDMNESNRKIGWATSVDGIHWQKYNDPNTTSEGYADSDPVLEPSFVEQWDADFIKPGTVMLEGNSLRMWYDGSRGPTDLYLWHIGHATISLDTLNKYLPLGLDKKITAPVPGTYTLKQNYPNPFNPATMIEFQILNSEYAVLKIYNILGSEVATLVSNNISAGRHTYRFDGSHLASGIYYYQLIAGNFKNVKKMILLR